VPSKTSTTIFALEKVLFCPSKGALLSSVSGSSRWQHVLQILNITQGYDDAALLAW